MDIMYANECEWGKSGRSYCRMYCTNIIFLRKRNREWEIDEENFRSFYPFQYWLSVSASCFCQWFLFFFFFRPLINCRLSCFAPLHKPIRLVTHTHTHQPDERKSGFNTILSIISLLVFNLTFLRFYFLFLFVFLPLISMGIVMLDTIAANACHNSIYAMALPTCCLPLIQTF